MNINWEDYVDHIFCISYLPNNRLNYISNELTKLGININNPKFFSFVYDYEHVILNDGYRILEGLSFRSFNKNVVWPFGGTCLYLDKHDYIFYLGLMTYRILKIAQYFKYKRIIIFEDDLVFLNDLEYIKNALDFIKSEQFDLCMCQTTFVQSFGGDKNKLNNVKYTNSFDNDMFLRTNKTIGVYGGGFDILTDKGINKIIKFFEENDIITCLDSLDTHRPLIQLDTIFALKPLCIQQHMLKWNEEELNENNVNINIEEYDQN